MAPPLSVLSRIDWGKFLTLTPDFPLVLALSFLPAQISLSPVASVDRAAAAFFRQAPLPRTRGINGLIFTANRAMGHSGPKLSVLPPMPLIFIFRLKVRFLRR